MKPLIRQLYYIAALIVSRLILLIPYRLAVLLGGFLGGCAYYLVADSRRITEENLSASFPEKSRAEIRKIARQVFVNQGKNAFELFQFPKLSAEHIRSLAVIENLDGLAAAFKQEKGVLLASAHCGNWEIMAAAIAGEGFPLNVIARRIYIEGLNRMLVGFRNSKKVKVILRSSRDSAKELLRSLRHKESLGLLIDQDTDVPGVFAEFFGRPAWTPSGLATLALRTGAPVLLALDARMPGDTHRVLLTGPLEMAVTGDMAQDVAVNTRRITAMIEDHVRRYPSQWVWMHRRWKTQQPAG